MSRRDHGDERCATCAMRTQLCICALTPSLSSSSSLTLLLHKDEAHKPTNTGALAARCLADSRIVIVGGDDVVDVAARDARPQLLLFPAEGAPVLTAADGPCELVVPDGTWRQARKMRSRIAGLASLPCRVLPATTMATTYRLRSERREGGLATLEAIAAALRILDGDTGDEVADAMLGVFRVMVSRTLWLRGQLRDDEVVGGVPEAARRHDPRGGLPPAP